MKRNQELKLDLKNCNCNMDHLWPHRYSLYVLVLQHKNDWINSEIPFMLLRYSEFKFHLNMHLFNHVYITEAFVSFLFCILTFR